MMTNFDKALMPLPQDQELAQFFTNKIKEEWEDKEEGPLNASRMPSKARGRALWVGNIRKGEVSRKPGNAPCQPLGTGAPGV